MIFRNIIFSALFVGILSGLIYGIFQQLQLSPIIYAAEQYEISDTASSAHEHGEKAQAHSHNAETWSPEDGAERILWTMFANILTGISFALVMLALMALHDLKANKPKLTAISGIGWGIAAMLSVFVSPALLGLHPEVPGTIAAELDNRQSWWLLCVSATMLGLAVLYYAPLKIKIIGLFLLALPHIIGAPLPEKAGFANPDSAAMIALSELSHQFYLMTAVGMVIFFIVLGVSSGYAVRKHINL